MLLGSKEAGERRPEAARENPRLRQYRLGAGDDADRSGRRHEEAVARARHEIADIDLFDLNEAFAAVCCATCRRSTIDPAKINVNGGAIALGHPLGATGAMISAPRSTNSSAANKTTALVTLCIGGGMGTATIIERV